MEQFVDGETLASLPALNREISSLMFSLTVERLIEGTHSILTRFVSHRTTTGTYVSFRLRLREIESFVEQDPGFLVSLADNMVRHPIELAKQLRVEEHPSLIDCQLRMQAGECSARIQ